MVVHRMRLEVNSRLFSALDKRKVAAMPLCTCRSSRPEIIVIVEQRGTPRQSQGYPRAALTAATRALYDALQCAHTPSRFTAYGSWA